ncbi:serine/threonine dehydratase [Alteromonas sp. a30]|uniref:serine/threonine dehydratase n=1 Tax=Alteromonas sp. a30 TaxID=2730917 RepID=UPI00227EAE9A|nr:serine/threonine dehydratase [Alteromonas sp. a30]MCY7294305.1 serine/threonine dehydratase [Alteromonas sp. a30]
MQTFSIQEIVQASRRVKPFIHHTPIVSSSLLNQWLGHDIFFKAECLQKIGAFKMRGATNFIARSIEEGRRPKRIVANSSGNHAQAVALAASLFDIPATIFTTESVSPVKAAATEYYGAELRKFPTRPEADQAAQEAQTEAGTVWIPPFNHYDVMAGQGTAAYEALTELGEVDAVFAPCGGGGLVSGTLVASRALSPQAQVVGCEPVAANDAARSRRSGKIESLDGPPATIADGVATPSLGDLTFPLVQQLDDFIEVEEAHIIYWAQWLQHLLKLHVEPTSAMCMQGVVQWLKQQESSSRKRILVILSGGNIAEKTSRQIWQDDHLSQLPSL